ncbi:MAG TPA: hypothetical protein VHT93_12660 [Pseudolabrys sp.]|jgi:DNA-binding XRE family transcriptional regulator|nr:hypothetical protein [Pseudolabrys sp.]
MAMAYDYPTDPRLQPVTIATATLEFKVDDGAWIGFLRSRASDFVEFDSAPKIVADAFALNVAHRIAHMSRQVLSEERSHYCLTRYDGKRGSLQVLLDFSVIPADITAIIGASAVVLYKSLKDYKTIRENVTLVYNDLAKVISLIAKTIHSKEPTLAGLVVEKHTDNLLRALSIAAVFEEAEREATVFNDKAFNERMAAERRSLEERLIRAKQEGRLGGDDTITLKID